MTSFARPMAVTACLGLSALSFVAIHAYETRFAEAASIVPDRPATPLARPTSVAASRPGSSVGESGVAAPSLTASTDATLASSEDALPAPTNERVVPDFVGMRLSEAKRTARSLGLRLRARTRGGSTIAADEARYYRVRTQRTSPGTGVAPDTVVDVRVREAVSYGGGY